MSDLRIELHLSVNCIHIKIVYNVIKKDIFLLFLIYKYILTIYKGLLVKTIHSSRICMKL